MSRRSLRTALACGALGGVLVLAAVVAGASSPARRSVFIRDVQASIFTHAPNGKCARGEKNNTGPGLRCIQLDTEIEPSISVNPRNPLNAVTAFQSGRVDAGGDATNGYATTFDGGRTWTHGLLPGLTKNFGGQFDRASDAAVAFGPNNVVYANSLVFDDTGQALRSGLATNVSHDGGRTWGPPAILQDDMLGGAIDKNWIGVDNGTGPGHHTGRVYVVWDRVAPVLAAYSDDQGVTWQTGPKFGYVVYPGQGIGALPLVLKDGSLGVVFETLVAPIPTLHASPGEDMAEPIPGFSKFVMTTALEAGSLPTGAPLVFGPPVSVGVDDVNSIRQQRSCDGTEQAAVDPGSGQVYVVWTDGRARGDGVNDIMLSRSDDNGITWTAPVRVNGGRTDDYLDSFCGAVDVGPAGDVRVSYRTRQESVMERADGSSFSDHVGTSYVESFDHGDTWTKPLEINTVANDMHFAAESRNGAFLGDYEAMAAAGPNTYVVREEPVRVNAKEPHTFPPAYHHQRTWVAVVGPASAAPSSKPGPKRNPAPRVKGIKTTRRSKGLAATGIPDGRVGLLLLAAAAASAAARRRLA